MRPSRNGGEGTYPSIFCDSLAAVNLSTHGSEQFFVNASASGIFQEDFRRLEVTDREVGLAGKDGYLAWAPRNRAGTRAKSRRGVHVAVTGVSNGVIVEHGNNDLIGVSLVVHRGASA
jgi:hypothetical protein